MSLIKIIVVFVAGGIVLFILLLVYTLWPTIRDVSSNKALNPFLHKTLTLKRKAFLHLTENAESTFVKYALNERADYPGILVNEIAPGTTIVVSKFKTYKNSVSGFTTLYALGTLIMPANERIEFENDMGGTDPALYTNETGLALTLALWQDSTDTPLWFKK